MQKAIYTVLRVLLIWLIALSPEADRRRSDPIDHSSLALADTLVISRHIQHHRGEKSPHADEAGSHHFVKFKQGIIASVEAVAIARPIDYYERASILAGAMPPAIHRPPIDVV